jgi:hypothetical protein
MDYTHVLPQTIGTNYGTTGDGVILGTVFPHVLSGSAYYTYAHEITYAIQRDEWTTPPTVSWVPIQAQLNASTAVQMFTCLATPPSGTTDPTPIPQMYYAVRDGVTGFTFNVTTALVGTFIFKAEYYTSAGWALLTTAVFSSNFMTATGLSTITFTPPSNWITSTIGYATPPEKWLRISFVGTPTITTPVTITGGWETTTALAPSIGGTTNVPFYNPYKNLLPATGDTLYLGSTDQPYGFVITYQTPLSSGNVTYNYMKADGTVSTLTPISDSSNGFTASNSQTYANYALTSTGATASIAGDSAISANGYATGTIANVPTSSLYAVTLGLSAAKTGTMTYALRAYWNGTAAAYQILHNGTAVFTSTLAVAANDKLTVMKYNDNIYFMVNDVNIDPSLSMPDTNALLYGVVQTPTTGTVVQNYKLVDWSVRKATPLALTFTTPTNFTTTSASVTGLFPCNYYIQFLPPTDFASVPASLSPLAVAGYVIGIVSHPPAGVSTPVQLMDQKMLTVGGAGNIFFPTGSQTIADLMNIKIQNVASYSGSAQFLLLFETSAGNTTRTVTYGSLATGSNILSSTFPNSGMTGIIIVQVAGDASWNVGSPAYITLST